MPITPVKTLVAQAKENIESLSLGQVQALIDQDKVLLVDIRDPRELAREGKIPGAFHAPRGMLEFWMDPQSPYHKPALATEKMLVLYCASAWRSALSVQTLQNMGVQNIAELEGGFSAWKAAGAPVDCKTD